MLKGLFEKGLLISVLALSINVSVAQEYTPNAFKTPPENTVQNASLRRGSHEGLPSSIPTGIPPHVQQAMQQGVTINGIPGGNSGLSNVNQALIEKEERSQKILDEVNKKMLKAKHVPVENSRYIGIINGKRVYQDNTTLEYVRVDLDK